MTEGNESRKVSKEEKKNKVNNFFSKRPVDVRKKPSKDEVTGDNRTTQRSL